MGYDYDRRYNLDYDMSYGVESRWEDRWGNPYDELDEVDEELPYATEEYYDE